MKLKPVVASLAMLGLMAPAFGKNSLASQQAVVDQNSVVNSLSAKDWFNNIQIGGKASIVGAFGNHNPVGTFNLEKQSSDLYVNNLNLLLDATSSSWSKLSANLAYLGAPKITTHGIKRHIKNHVIADEVYLTLGDLNQLPFYFIAGKKYIPFGDYADPYTPIAIMSPAQMLAQTNAVAAIAGVSTDFGLYGSLYGFRGETSPISATTGKIRNFGAKLGYHSKLANFKLDDTSFNVALGYIYNILDGEMFQGSSPWEWSGNHPDKHAYGVSAHLDLAYKAFNMFANWVGAMQNIQTKGSKAWGADLGATYAFQTFSHDSHFGATGHWAGNGDSFQNTIFPKWRLAGEYGIELFKNTDLTLTVAHSRSFDFTTDKKERNTTLGLARLAVKL